MPAAGRIEQQRAAERKLRSLLRAEPRIHLEGANHRELHGNRRAILRRFVAVQLHGIKRHGARDLQHLGYIHIYEYTHQLDPAGFGAGYGPGADAGNRPRNLPGLLQPDAARASRVEINPQHGHS